jgi:hypothetical protein
MQEKSQFMGISDMQIVRNIEPVTNVNDQAAFGILNRHLSPNRASIFQPNRKLSMVASIPCDDLLYSPNPTIRTSFTFDNKHDTRVVNEAFQVLLFHSFNYLMRFKFKRILTNFN